MSKHFKLLALILSVILCLTAFTVCVYAVDLDGDGIDDGEGGGGEVIDTQPYYTDPYVEPEPVYTDPPVYTNPVYTTPESSANNNDYNNNYNNNNSSSYSFEDEPSYLGGGQSYIPPESTAPSVSLIDSDDNIDVNELSGNDWSDIAAKLKNTSNSSDADDFGFIQNNNSAGDNGEWLLVSGIVLVVLGIGGLIYFIVTGHMRRKRLAFAGSNGTSVNKGGAGHYRPNNDYNDGYRTSRASSSPAKRSKRYDTSEIAVPRKTNNRRYK